jgi:hypothetical protein
MWIELDETAWKKEESILDLPLFYDSKYLNSIALVYNLKVNYYCFKTSSKTLALISFFSTKSKIVTPEGFSYSPYFIIENLSEIVYFDINNSLISLLKKKFRSIYLKLGINITDVRPFIWNGFKIQTKYTHLKNNLLSSHKTVIKNLSKIIDEKYYFEVEQPCESSIRLNMDFLQKLGISKFNCVKYEMLLMKWTENGYLKAFNVYKNQQLLCSNLVLVDENTKRAYTILLNNVDFTEKYAHTFLYQSITDWCFKKGIFEIDFCGANIPGISIFKSYFTTELKIYYKISYNSFSNSLYGIKQNVFSILYKIKGRLSYVLG